MIRRISLVITIILKIWAKLNAKETQFNWINLTTSRVFGAAIKKNQVLWHMVGIVVNKNLRTISLEQRPFIPLQNEQNTKEVYIAWNTKFK
jgi:hypothetical protein